MATIMHLLSIRCIILLTIIPTLARQLSKQVNHSRIITQLIHYKSHNSPYYNSSLSIAELAARDWEISSQRVHYLSSDIWEKEDVRGIQTIIFAKSYLPLFLVKFRIGTPPIPQVVVLDTGSPLLWLKCGPSFNGGDYTPEDQLYNIFNPGNSSTFNKHAGCYEYCGDDLHCFNGCYYQVKYKTTKYTYGELGSERLLFSTPMNGRTTLPNIVFGCSSESDIPLVNGILGLGAAKISILYQLKLTQFSYCLSNLSSPYYETNALILGQNFNKGGLPTPLIREESKYFVNLEGISFGGRRLAIDKQGLRRTSGRGGALIDSGSSITLLQTLAYSKLEEAIILFIRDDLERADYTNEQNIRQTCFVGDLRIDFDDFPSVILHFDGGASMELDYENIFEQISEDMVCLGVIAAEDLYDTPYSIIGANFQQYFYIAFDLAEEEVSFAKTSCEFLWDGGDGEGDN